MTSPTLVFDLDGTLVDSAPDLAGATNAVLKANGRRTVSLDEVRDMVGHGARKLIIRGFERTGSPVEDDRIEPLFQHFIEHYTANIAVESRPYPGIVALLEKCRENGIDCAVCTNKLEALSVKLINELKLDTYFRAIIGPDTIGVAKPDPAPLFEAIGRSGGNRSRSFMIGDSATDINTAKAAGIPVIAVSFGYTDKHVSHFDPDYIVDHIDEIWELIQSHQW